MKDIREYINESLRLDEAKKAKIKDVLKGIESIDKWNKADNIKKLMAEYMSAGDAEDIDPKHWDACVAVVDMICQTISDDLDGGDDTIDIEALTNYIADRLEDNNEEFIDDLNKDDKEGDWDVDACINLFNTVSQKVYKATWLI